MPAVCLYFQVHQPLRIKRYKVFDIGKDHNYFNDGSDSNLNNLKILRKVSEKAYLPANEILLRLLKKYKDFKVSFSFSGVVLEQFQKFYPKVLTSFKKLVKTGKVEVLSETYYHSLSFFYSPREFSEQVLLHQEKIEEVFEKEPKIFRNTELAYSNELAVWAEKKGYIGILAEGWDEILGWRSPNFIYKPKGTKRIKLMLKNYKLSDDIAFRFSERSWNQWPLTSEKFSSWISSLGGNAQVVNLFMDYETFGEHQWGETGIFNFLQNLPEKILKDGNFFITPTEAVKSFPAMDTIDVPRVITWADTERDLSAWIGNEMQKSAIEALYRLEKDVLSSANKRIIEDWRKLQISDHFYYMCTKWYSDGDVHKYFNPYESPYDAYIFFMNALMDLKLRLKLSLRRQKGVSYSQKKTIF